MADYRSYLAASILTEDKVTYRLLSRVLNIHVNAAKEMLFEFHRVQNAKKPGTIHATYLIAGTKRKQAPVAIEVEKDGEDYYMQSSPFVGSSMPQSEGGTGQGSILSITLAREEDLETIRAQFEHISSIHIYSLGPHPLKELQLLSDSTREIQTLLKSEDPLESYHKYGIITNPNAKRRTRKAPPIAANVPTAVPTRPAAAKSRLNEVQEPSKSSSSYSKKPEPKSQPSNAKDFFGNKGKEKTKSSTQAESSKAESTTAPSSKESTSAPPANLKRESSSIFKAFAKTQLKKAKIDKTDSNAKEEDTPMKDVSDDDDDDDTWMPAPVTEETKANERRSRKELQERLRKMMEDDDEEEQEGEAAPSPAPETPMEGPEEDNAPEEANEEEPITTSNGRRRGRRRIMKKKTVKDEDGYLVTKQEQAWESFSEDEPLSVPKAKPSVPTTSKAKKDAPKKGQGSIMSFFGKK